MKQYRIAGQEFTFLQPVTELEPFEITEKQGTADKAVPCFNPGASEQGGHHPLPSPTCQTTGWVAGEMRQVKVYEQSTGTTIVVEKGGTFCITRDGHTIGKADDQGVMTPLDFEVMAGSVFTLALAMRGVWSLHASAAIHQGNLIVILGESGEGKSTLAAYLDESGWQRAADDILPVVSGEDGLMAYPHYPQLKLGPQAQPWLKLPEQLPVHTICLLSPADPGGAPALVRLSASDAAKVLLSHSAGTRLLGKELLRDHLAFGTHAARQTACYRLSYPHRREALPQVRELLEELC